MSKVIFDKDGRIGRISLNRPEKLNAIDDDVSPLTIEPNTESPRKLKSLEGCKLLIYLSFWLRG